MSNLMVQFDSPYDSVLEMGHMLQTATNGKTLEASKCTIRFEVESPRSRPLRFHGSSA